MSTSPRNGLNGFSGCCFKTFKFQYQIITSDVSHFMICFKIPTVGNRITAFEHHLKFSILHQNI